MSKWGVFVDHDGKHLHVAPCSAFGIMLPPHHLSRECQCQPRIDDVNARLIIHNDPERGGMES